MATIKPFRAFRPVPEYAVRVASLPYDVIDSEEARAIAKDNPYSFLHVVKAEIDLDPAVDSHAPQVYEQARNTLNRMIADGILVQDHEEGFYIYRETFREKTQTGLVVCTPIDEYIDGTIKIHEHTRPDKVRDRMQYIESCEANTGLIFLTYRPHQTIAHTLEHWISTTSPVYDFTSDDGVSHTVWGIYDREIIRTLVHLFVEVPALYIADGHHRTASAVNVGLKKREQHAGYTGNEGFNYFLSVLFPSDQVSILSYNRVIADIQGLSTEEFLQQVGERFEVDEYQKAGPYHPAERHTFGMYLNQTWYTLHPKAGTYQADDPAESLDIAILQNNILQPILGIHDPRTDRRIDFVGGIRGLQELERRVADDMALAFSLYPTSIQEVLAIADAGETMPPKSTWFEPKLRSGLFVHKFL